MTQPTHCRFRPLTARLALVAVIATTTAGIALARPTQPTAAERQITLAVSMLMERQHLTGQHLDKTMSERALKTFIKDLDPLKLFFYQSDIDEFQKLNKENSIGDALKKGNVTFAYDIFSRFLARVDERITMAEADLNKPQNFDDPDDKMIRDPRDGDLRQNAGRSGRSLAPTREVRPVERDVGQSADGRSDQEAHQAVRQHSQELAAN